MNNDALAELFERGVSSFIDPDGSFKDKVFKKSRGEYEKDIVIKLGADPNRPDIHLGHAVILRRLRQFQDLGCKVIFLIGDFTARIGDPSGKSKVRPELEQAEVEKNATTYIEQVGKILRTDDPRLFSWIRNSDWFTNITDLNLPSDSKITMNVSLGDKKADVPIDPNSFVGKAIAFEQSRMQVRDLKLKNNISVITLSGLMWSLRHITHQKLLDRDMFQERIKSGDELYMHEVMYPVLQGIDSLVLSKVYGSCDLEVGGSDQTFNMLMGRDVMRANGTEPQAVMSFDILIGTDGKEKMSKSLDNYIGINEPAQEIYGKTMSVPDNAMLEYFKLATYTPLSEVKEMGEKLESGKLHPKDLKMRLAREIVAIYHGEEAAKDAEKSFTATFSKGGVPSDIATIEVSKGEKLSDILVREKVIESKSEFQRLVKEGAVKMVDQDKSVEDPTFTVDEEMTLRIGKHRFIKIEVR